MKTATKDNATATHTPGPWEHIAPMGEGDHAVLSETVTSYGNFYVATLPNGDHAQAAANAKLIAAAPEMLAALQTAYTSLIARLGPSHEVTAAVGSAIAKATK